MAGQHRIDRVVARIDAQRLVAERDQLLDRIKGRGADEVFDRSIDTQISRLRRKLEDDPRNPKLIACSSINSCSMNYVKMALMASHGKVAPVLWMGHPG